MTSAADPAPRRGGTGSIVVLLVGGAAAVILATGVRAVGWLIAPVMLALVVVITVRPVHGWLHRRGLPRWAAGLVLLVLVYAVIVVLAGGIVASVARLITLLPGYRAEAYELLGSVFALLREHGIGPVPLAEIAASLDLGRVAGVLATVLGGVVGLTGNVVFLLSVMLFLTIESGGFRAKLAVLAEARPATAAALEAFAVNTRRFLVVTTIFGLLTAVVDTVALLALGIPLALLWGVLAFITNYIPYVGFFIGIVPPAVLALLEGGWTRFVLVVVIYVVVNFVLCSLVQPRYIGDAVGLSLTVVFLSLGFWAWMLGPLGAVLAVPLTLLVKALLVDAHPRVSWVSSMLAARAVPPAAASGQGEQA
ncbi:AI-2E family transporter [Actinomycetospora endophytica]|uniref:AI-2E family transporter n=1 Tax=Actinomycetospora endophytica TaxID=2291215 RepID=A0ABS8PBD0_9PSEU|nr:AI-2E family transporter [Actinomycetospora endophytica]MCD2195439.1 AI-2E family transporter [Actinomycetospora endophytica]